MPDRGARAGRGAAAARPGGDGVVAIRAVAGITPQVDAGAWVAESAEVDGDVGVGPDAGIWYMAVLRGDIAPIRIGARSNIQDGSILHTDVDRPCLIGREVTVGHGAVLHGCAVGDGALIGMRATILSGASVGPGALVAAGAVVGEGQVIPAGTVAMGVPARVVRPVRPGEAERMRRGVEHYIALAGLHRAAAEAQARPR